MPRENPWHDIGAASAPRIRAKRVDGALKHDFFWACNSEGRYTFLLQIDSDPGDWGPAPELRGISVAYYRGERQFQLVLADRAEWEIFFVLCEDLVHAVDECRTSREVMDALMARLLRWQRLLSRGPRRILDEREIRGLLGELLFLRDELMPRFGPRAVQFWQGPERLPQDFVVGGHLFEVKTHLVGNAPKIYVSSLEQLWGGPAPLFLLVTPLARCGRQAVGVLTLPSIVEEVAAQVANTANREAFESTLAASGYLPFPEYHDETYIRSLSTWYEVGEGFPRVRADAVPEGVVDLKYAIRLSACEPFKAGPNWGDVMVKAQ